MSDVNVALPTFAAARLLLSASHAAINRYLLPTGSTAANRQQRHPNDGSDRQTDGCPTIT